MNRPVETPDPFYQGILDNALRYTPPHPRGLAALMPSTFRFPILHARLPHPTGFRMPHPPVQPHLTRFQMPHVTAPPQQQSGNHMVQTTILTQHQNLQMVHNFILRIFIS